MDTITISPRFQVVIPKTIRDQLQLKPGQKLQVLAYEGRIELIPVGRLQDMRGFLRGVDVRIERAKDRA